MSLWFTWSLFWYICLGGVLSRLENNCRINDREMRVYFFLINEITLFSVHNLYSVSHFLRWRMSFFPSMTLQWPQATQRVTSLTQATLTLHLRIQMIWPAYTLTQTQPVVCFQEIFCEKDCQRFLKSHTCLRTEKTIEEAEKGENSQAPIQLPWIQIIKISKLV